MKATSQHTLFCECNHPLLHEEGGTVRCAHRPCKHYGKRFLAPVFELVEVPNLVGETGPEILAPNEP